MDYEITPQELRQRRQRNEPLTVLDVREPWERQTASIVNSYHIPMADVPARLQELDPDQHIVVHCHHGVRSLSVTDWLRKQGYDKAQSMAGGIDRWSLEIDPTVPRDEPRSQLAACCFCSRPVSSSADAASSPALPRFRQSGAGLLLLLHRSAPLPECVRTPCSSISIPAQSCR